MDTDVKPLDRNGDVIAEGDWVRVYEDGIDDRISFEPVKVIKLIPWPKAFPSRGWSVEFDQIPQGNFTAIREIGRTWGAQYCALAPPVAISIVGMINGTD